MKKKNAWILALVLLSFVVCGIFLCLAPEEIPVHYNARGEIDRWGSKYEYLVMPILTAFFAAVMAFVARLEGKQGRPENEKVIATVMVYVLLMFNGMWAFFMVQAVNTAGAVEGLSQLPTKGIMIAMMALFILMGNIMPKAGRNSVLGLRTKWSMADDVCWQKSQRMGSFWMVGTGVVGVIAASLLPVDWVIPVMGALMIVMIVGSVTGTYLIWKRQTK